MEKLGISEIAAACGGTANGSGDVFSICTDSRKIEKGCLFIAIEGEKFDGHDFAQKAIDSGAAAVMCHKDADCSGTVIKVDDTRKALLSLAGYYRSKFDIPVVAITGSVGKTTTKEMTHAVISKKYKTLKNIGNFNNEIGMPMTVFGLDGSFQAAVLEMGMSGFGEIYRLSSVAKPTIGIITNIGVSHMEKLGSQLNILKAKLEIVNGMKDGAPLVFNGDDMLLRSAETKGHPKIYFGIKSSDCRFKAESIEQHDSSTEFDIKFDGKVQHITIPTIGEHNVMNALAAFSAGILLGIEPAAAAEALSAYVPSGMRQRKHRIGGITVIEDCYNASPDSMKAALKTLASTKAERRIAVFADMLELGSISKQAHYDVGKLAAEHKIDMLFSYGNEAEYYIKGAKDGGLSACVNYPDKEDLTNALYDEIRQGDAVLFKASRGMKLEDVILSLYERWNNN